jgi:colanic acid/amylovoran biosynthesis glycosyltransferase
VQILGFKNRSEVRQLYRTAHIFLLPSVTARDGDREGSPVVLLEAQAAGLPVVATRHSAIPEIVADGQSGYLVPERDADALAARLRDLLANPARWAEFGRAGRAIIVENHDQRRHCDRLEQLCLRVLHHPAGAGERR